LVLHPPIFLACLILDIIFLGFYHLQQIVPRWDSRIINKGKPARPEWKKKYHIGTLICISVMIPASRYIFWELDFNSYITFSLGWSMQSSVLKLPKLSGSRSAGLARICPVNFMFWSWAWFLAQFMLPLIFFLKIFIVIV
jgi:hypothetical protein